MTKLMSAVIVCAALALAGIETGARAAQPGFAPAGPPRAAARAPAAPRAAAPTAPPRFTPAPAPANRNFGNVQPHVSSPGVNTGQIRAPNPAFANRHFRGGAPYDPNAPQVIPKAPPVAALNRYDRRDHRGRRYVGSYPYLYGYGAGLGVPYVSGGYLSDNGAYGVCFRLLQKYRETGASKWRRRYDKCLAGDYSQLDYL